MRIILRFLRILNDVNAIKRGTYGRRVSRQLLNKGIRRFFR